MFFDEELTGPFIHSVEDDFTNPGCKIECGGCNLVDSMRYIRYGGEEVSPVGVNIGKTICHGLRASTDEEKADMALFGRELGDTVCDIEIVISKPE